MQRQLENIAIDDDVLVRKARQGDTGAIGRLILKYQNRVYNIILKICGNSDDAAELTQDTFVKVIENIDKFRHESSFYTWLFRVAVNLTYNHCKRDARFSACSLEQLAGECPDGTRAELKSFLADDDAADPAKLAQDKEIQQLALKALQNLDEGQRIIVVLRDIEGFSYDEISQMLQIELGTVKSRLSRARAKLSMILEAITR